MEKSILERETETAVETEVKKEEVQTEQETTERKLPKITIKRTTPPQETVSHQTEYLNSLEDMTIGDFKKQEEEEKAEKFKQEKEQLIQQQFEETATEKETKTANQNIIEKPNYDLIEENKKIVKLGRRKEEKEKPVKKKRNWFLALAIAFGIGATICVTNAVLIDNMQSAIVSLDETYELNLAKYLKNLAKLDTTKESMEIIPTYPEDFVDAGETGKKSNWFDRVCNFIGGIFGG